MLRWSHRVGREEGSMGRVQSGYVYQASGALYVRYWTSEIVDGKSQRVQRSERLCDADDKCYISRVTDRKTGKKRTVLSSALKLKLNDKMQKVNSQEVHRRPGQDMTVADFWETRYLPYLEEMVTIKDQEPHPRKKPSTVRGYKQIWKQHLKDHFADTSLRLRAVDGHGPPAIAHSEAGQSHLEAHQGSRRFNLQTCGHRAPNQSQSVARCRDAGRCCRVRSNSALHTGRGGRHRFRSRGPCGLPTCHGALVLPRIATGRNCCIEVGRLRHRQRPRSHPAFGCARRCRHSKNSRIPRTASTPRPSENSARTLATGC